MAGLNDIKNGSELDIGIDNIKANFQTSQDNIKSILEEFIMTMPDFINLSIAGKTDYTSMDDFWSKISKNGVEPDIDDLIKYIEQNYIPDIDEKENGDIEIHSVEINNLANGIDRERSTLIEGLLKEAKDIISKLETIITNNENIIVEMQEEKASLEAQIKVLKDQLAEQEAIENNATDTDKIMNAKIKVAELQGKLTDRENLITNLDSTINTATDSVAQIRKDLLNKKNDLKKFFKDNRIELKENEKPDTQQQENGNQQHQNPGNGYYKTAPQQQDAENGLSNEEKTEFSALPPRDKAKYMLKMLQDAKYSKQAIYDLLDREGFGDVMEMSKYLGPVGRKELRTIIQNRADDLAIDLNNMDLNGNAFLTAQEITDFMQDINNKTAKEIREFEARIQIQKYDFLLDSTKKGPLRRFLARVTGNKEFEAIESAGKNLTRYFDNKKEKETKKRIFGDMLRVKVGKIPVNVKENSSRLSRDKGREF